jgi:2-oxoglutarate ferredoxin oxidoreductase subunit delta
VTKATTPRTKRAVTEITIDRDLCKVCGICIALCLPHVFDADASGYPLVARLDECTSCQFCERHCPDFAIDLVWGERAVVKRSAAAAKTSAEDES